MTPSQRPRLGALDLLRGAAVAAMIVVNNPGNWNAVLPPLTHAPWNGLTVADVIFPSFIFVMGAALGLRPSTSGIDRAFLSRVCVRSARLIGLGLLLNLAAAWAAPFDARLPGVLQRIGLTYLVAAPLVRGTSARAQWLWVACLLVLHTWLLLVGGTLEPGRHVGVLIDRAIFGHHLLSPAGDPEGLIGLPSSVVTALLGAAAARLTVRVPGRSASVWSVCGFGAALMAAGAAATLVIPVNKALWTASFALMTGGIASVCLAACLLAPSPPGRALAPGVWLGTNPLAIYFLSELCTIALQQPVLVADGHAAASKDLLFWSVLVPLVGDGGGPMSSLIYALGYVGLWVAVAGLLHQRGITLRV